MTLECTSKMKVVTLLFVQFVVACQMLITYWYSVFYYIFIVVVPVVVILCSSCVIVMYKCGMLTCV